MKKYNARPDAIVQARKNKGLSQSDLAALIGFKQPYICNLEKGIARLDAKKARMISAALEADFDEIFYDPDAEFTLPHFDHYQLSILDLDIFQDVIVTIESSYSLESSRVSKNPQITKNLLKLLKFHPMLLARIESLKKQLTGFEKEVFQSGKVRVSSFDKRSCSGDHYKDFEYQKALEKKYQHMVLGYLYSSLLISCLCQFADQEELEMIFNFSTIPSSKQKQIRKRLTKLIERSNFHVNADHLERLITILEEYSESD